MNVMCYILESKDDHICVTINHEQTGVDIVISVTYLKKQDILRERKTIRDMEENQRSIERIGIPQKKLLEIAWVDIIAYRLQSIWIVIMETVNERNPNFRGMQMKGKKNTNKCVIAFFYLFIMCIALG